MRMTTLLVPEIHPGNALFYWMLSFVVRVKSLYFHPLCARLEGTRIGQVDGADVFSCQEGWAFRVRTFLDWVSLEKRIPRSDWQAKFRDVALDFTTRAKQDLWRTFEDCQLLKAVHEAREPGGVYVVRSSRVAYMVGLEHASHLFAGVQVARCVSLVHGLLDRIWEGGQHTARLVRLAARLVLAIVARLSPTRETLTPCSILYLCDNLNDLHESSDRRSFTWVLDGERICEKDVLFVLPEARDERLERLLSVLPGTTIQAGRLQDLYRQVPIAQLGRSLGHVLTRAPVAAIAPFVSSVRSMHERYVLSSMEFDPIVRHVCPTCCLETDSSMGVERPALVYFRQLEIATVMCHFSAVLLFYTRPGGNAVRDFVYAHPVASHIVCWNEHAKELVKAHPHEGTEVLVLGPMMPGRDDVLAEHRCALRARTLPPNKPRSLIEKKWVSVFDVMPTPAPRPRHPGLRGHAEPYTEHYWIGFVRDMLRLLDDDLEMVMVYKPKRAHVVGELYPLSAWFPTRATEYAQLMGAIHQHERMILLEEDLNPWIALAVADLCITIPSSSPVCAAWHLGVPGIYHDPLGQLDAGDYDDIGLCVTRDYQALRSKAQECLQPGGVSSFTDILQSRRFRPYLGRTPGGSATSEFRDLVVELAHQRRTLLATRDVVVPQTH